MPTHELTRATTFTGFDPDFEESGSFQRILAALVDSAALPVEPDPCLRRDSDDGETLLELKLGHF